MPSDPVSVHTIFLFRVDFSGAQFICLSFKICGYQQQSVEDQWIITDLAMSETTNAVARKYGVSAGLISQYRKRYAKSWKSFLDPPTEEKGMLVPA